MNNNVIKKQFDSIGSNFDVVPQYNVFKQKYSSGCPPKLNFG